MKHLPDRKVWAGGIVAVGAWFLASRYGLAAEDAFFAALAVGKVAEYLIPPPVLEIAGRITQDMVDAARAAGRLGDASPGSDRPGGAP